MGRHNTTLPNMRKEAAMSNNENDNLLNQMALEIGPNEMVTHLITIAVITTPGTWDEEVRITTTAHTGRVMAFGAISEALEQVRYPAYDVCDEDEED